MPSNTALTTSDRGWKRLSDGDNPAWTDEGDGHFTRAVGSIGGDLGAIYSSEAANTTFQLANLHGDVVAETAADLNTDPGLLSTSESTEYGTPRDSSQIGTKRYGWLGAKQRAADTPAGIVLMGHRLYNPATGRFLQVDPIPGGSCNDYDYTCADPVNNEDLDGQKKRKKKKKCSGWWGCSKKWLGDNAGDISAVVGTVSLFLPPPANLIGGAVALGFGAYAAYRDVKRKRYASAGLTLAGAIPGVGALARGVRYYRTAKRFKSAMKGVGKYKAHKGSRKSKNRLVAQMRKARTKNAYAQRSAKRWERYTYPFALWDASKFGCSRYSRCKRRMPSWA